MYINMYHTPSYTYNMYVHVQYMYVYVQHTWVKNLLPLRDHDTLILFGFLLVARKSRDVHEQDEI